MAKLCSRWMWVLFGDNQVNGNMSHDERLTHISEQTEIFKKELHDKQEADFKGIVLIDGTPATIADFKQWETKLRVKEIKNERKRGRYTVSYKRWRMAVLERDSFTCIVCGCVGGHLEVHHKQSYACHPSLRENLDNGITICYECHSELHGSKWGWFYKK